MPLYIREGRFGPPKSFKTGAVVSSYPKPLLAFEFDPDGLSVVREPVKFITVEELPTLCKAEQAKLPPITAIDFAALNMADFKVSRKQLSVDYVPTPDAVTFPKVAEAANAVLFQGCPWRTFVLDTVTGLSNRIYGHQSATKQAALADPRKWAGNIGMKVQDYLSALLTLPCHVVIIMHDQTEQNELTNTIARLPMIYSKVRESVGNLFSQFFYQQMEAGKPKVRTVDFELVRGIGCRWPQGLPATCGPLFDDIYKGVKFEA